MCHVVNVVLSQEINSDYPRARAEHLVDPLAVLEDINTFKLVHYQLAFLLVHFPVRAHSDDQVAMLEKLLGLLQHPGVSYVVHIEDSIGVDSHWILGVAAVWHSWSYHGVVVLGEAVWEELYLSIDLDLFALSSYVVSRLSSSLTKEALQNRKV